MVAIKYAWKLPLELELALGGTAGWGGIHTKNCPGSQGGGNTLLAINLQQGLSELIEWHPPSVSAYGNVH